MLIQPTRSPDSGHSASEKPLVEVRRMSISPTPHFGLVRAIDRPECDSGAYGLGPLLSLKKATVKETVALSPFTSVF
jgi:hypothetical protein